MGEPPRDTGIQEVLEDLAATETLLPWAERVRGTVRKGGSAPQILQAGNRVITCPLSGKQEHLLREQWSPERYPQALKPSTV